MPRAYSFFATLSLATAGLVMFAVPRQLTGFFYHPRLLAVVHLLTLGWITGGLLARFEAVRLRHRPPQEGSSRWGERLTFGIFVLGATGVMSHFWIGEMSGVGLSGILVALTTLRLGVRGLADLYNADLPEGVLLGCGLAFGNLAAAVLLGMLIALDRYVDVLAGFVLHHVYAHAHLAALGWAAMLWLALATSKEAPQGVGRKATRLWFFEVGVLGVVASLFAGGSAGAWHFPPALLLALAGCLAAGRGVGARGMEMRLALASWGAAGALAVVLVLLPSGELTLRLVPAYGGLALLGFLSVGIAGLGRGMSTAEAPGRGRLAGWLLGSLLVPLAFAFDNQHLLRLGGLALVLAAVGEGLAHRRAQGSISTSAPSTGTP